MNFLICKDFFKVFRIYFRISKDFPKLKLNFLIKISIFQIKLSAGVTWKPVRRWIARLNNDRRSSLTIGGHMVHRSTRITSNLDR